MTKTWRRPLNALTGMRFFAAVAVLLYHYGAGFAERKHLPWPLTHLLHNGFLGVSLFFVLSGFIITYAHFTDTMTPAALGRYYWARIARIYPVYVLALVLALPTLTAPLKPLDVVSVLTMTQAWTVPASSYGFTWVMQAWTLSVEIVFYILFPFAWPVIRRFSLGGTIALAVVCAVLIIAFGGPAVTPMVTTVPLLGNGTQILIPVFRMPEFFFGVAICQLFMGGPQLPPGRLADVLELGLALGMITVLVIADNVQVKAIFAILTGLFILVTAHGAGVVSRVLSTRLLLLLGGASYALYILQEPLRALCAALVVAPYDAMVSPIVTITGAIVVFKFVEQPARRRLLLFVSPVSSKA